MSLAIVTCTQEVSSSTIERDARPSKSINDWTVARVHSLDKVASTNFNDDKSKLIDATSTLTSPTIDSTDSNAIFHDLHVTSSALYYYITPYVSSIVAPASTHHIFSPSPPLPSAPPASLSPFNPWVSFSSTPSFLPPPVRSESPGLGTQPSLSPTVPSAAAPADQPPVTSLVPTVQPASVTPSSSSDTETDDKWPREDNLPPSGPENEPDADTFPPKPDDGSGGGPTSATPGRSFRLQQGTDKNNPTFGNFNMLLPLNILTLTHRG